MALRIIPATEDQIQLLHKIFTQANTYKVDHGDRAWEPGFSLRGVKWMLSKGTIYTVYRDGMIVGTVTLDWEDDAWDSATNDQAGYIHRLGIGNEFHGQHLGAQIIDWAASQVACRDRTRLRLDSNVANQELCKYYEKQGFKLVSTKEFPDYNYTAALYERQIEQK